MSTKIKLRKKVKLGTASSKSSKDGGETQDFKKKGFRGNRNAQFSMDDVVVDVRYGDNRMYKKENGGRSNVRSKRPKDDGETLDFKKKGFRRNRNAQFSMEDSVDIHYGDNKLYRKENGGRSNVSLKINSKSVYERKFDGNRGFKPINDDCKRKRVYADRDNSKNVETPTRKVLSKRWNELKDGLAKGKRTTRVKSHDFEQPEKVKFLKGERKFRETESLDSNGGKKLRLKAVDKMDRGGISLMKTDAKNKFESRKQSEQNHDGYAAEPLGKFAKKKAHDKKSVGDDWAGNVDRRKKRKPAIRIDPHDISNKRLDDGIATIGHNIEKKEDEEKNTSVEMSKNAEFRAIKPSPSILSFVEDNFLGRRRLIELRRAGYNTELSAPLDNIPFSRSAERERIEESIFRNKLTFFAAANVSSSFLPPELPEIAFAGRSNVGKSSLLNSLTRQWGVVRTSDKPGLTQTINFFKLGLKLCLVDLPGYGFAYAKEEVKEAWEELVKEYVSTRVGLKRVCLLIDTKWGMKPRDHELIDLMERSQTKYQIVLTKTDLVFPIDVARRAMQIEENLKAKKSAVQPVMMVSSKSGAGIQFKNSAG
ncbi:putative GTP-binding protein EngB [Camellia lanceoleosa]|uniref:GTP-binding protein EngB n=1 Tax=Camellia lanceoleosa TaxID=1840588 RepID=A0ACC0HM68_9ERIC|nr:putative GTP-binding protein EngB [Camellia lanceoleosa]